MFRLIFFCVAVLSAFDGLCQDRKETNNIILITLDGFRWQEVFRGADPTLLANTRYSPDRKIAGDFAKATLEERRKTLLPFFWNTIAKEGQLYGDRDLSSFLNCANNLWFSYPGYHELLVGAVNRKVCSNLKIENPDITVLEYLNQQPEYHNSIKVFATWDVFPFILSEKCSGISVNAGLEPVHIARELSENELSMNAQQATASRRTDSLTFHLAFESLKRDRPKILYIALDETDHFAHHDRYDLYLDAARRTSDWLTTLWSWIQSDPDYKDHTTLVLTTDHGRGQNNKKTWRHHGRLTFGSGQIWMAAIGPDTPPIGIVKGHHQLYQKQIATSLANFLGFNYINKFGVGSGISSLLTAPSIIAQAPSASVHGDGQ